MNNYLKDYVAYVLKQKIKPTQVVKQTVDKISKNSHLNIFTQVFEEQALKKAREIEVKIKNKQPVGRLAGVVFCAKDNFLYKDTLTTAAAPFLQNHMALYTATCLQKILDEDAILIGKTNLDAFAHGTSTENSYFKATKNPHNLQKTPGGSSGGSAAAVATNICPFSLGTDTGGSIRLPASFCGVVGFKPTYGLLSRWGIVAMASSTDCVGPFTQNPSDALYLLNILKGQDKLDSTTFDSAQLSTEPAVDLKSLKIGIIKEFTEGLDKEVDDAYQKAVANLKDQGALIKVISLPNINLALACYYVLVSAEISSNLSRYDGLRYGLQERQADWQSTVKASRQNGFMAENKRRIMLGTYVLSQGYYEAYYHKAQKLRTLLIQEFQEAFKTVDVLLSPTSPTTAFDLGSKLDNPLQMYLADLMTVAPSLAGLPATSLSLPTKGLPVGLQIITPFKTDFFNLKLANLIFKKQS